jgi:hypothetical protein
MASHAQRGIPVAWSRSFLVVAGLTTIGYFFLATGAQSILYDGIALGAAGAMFAGVAVSRPQPLSAYVLLATGVLLLGIGDILYGISQPVPSLADVLYVTAYPLIGLGLMGLVRRRQPIESRSPLIEAMVVAVGIGVIAMALLLVPSGDSESLGYLTPAVALGYPLMDVALIAILVRALRSDTERRVPFLLIGLALVSLLVADVGYVLLDFGTGYAVGEALDIAWLLAYVCFGAALLNPPIIREGFARYSGKAGPSAPPSPKQVPGSRSWAATAMSQGLRFRMLLMWTGRLLLGLMVFALIGAVSWQSPHLVALAGAYGGTGILIIVAGYMSGPITVR